jgi:hypothetical protein
MINKLYQLLCAHNSGITIVTAKQYEAGCTYVGKYKYVICSRCGKTLIDRDVMEEYECVRIIAGPPKEDEK